MKNVLEFLTKLSELIPCENGQHCILLKGNELAVQIKDPYTNTFRGFMFDEEDLERPSMDLANEIYNLWKAK